MSEFQKITLVKVLENKAYFSTPQNQEVILPKSFLPENFKIGQSFYLSFSESLAKNKISLSEARALLEEILNSQ